VEDLIEDLKQQSLIFAGKSLEYLKEKNIEWAINLSNFALEKLQDFLWDKYQNSSKEEQEIFQNKIMEKFPESSLAFKLQSSPKR